MTETEFLAMEPREQDALVAEAFESRPVYLHRLGPCEEPRKSKGGFWMEYCEYATGDVPAWYPLHFTTSIADAWTVVEKMREDGWMWSIEEFGHGTWRATVGHRGVEDGDIWVYHEAWSEDAEEAICLAALKARGVIA